MSDRKLHTGLAAGDVGGYVLMPGDPDRTALIARHFDGVREIAARREFRKFTGKLDGQTVSACSTGIGGPSAAIVCDELADLGVHTFLRVGTCGGAQPKVKLGDLVIATGAVRSEGASGVYVPPEYPAVADHAMVQALVEAAEAAKAAYHLGVVRTVDALAADISPARLPRAHELSRETDVWARAGVLANDMESSTILVLASSRGLRAGSVLMCVNEVGAGAIQPYEPSAMDRLISVAVDATRRLIAAR